MRHYLTPCGPLHFDGRMWRPSSDWKGRTPNRLTVLLDATPWARMRPHLRAIVDHAERGEYLHDNPTKRTLETLFVDQRCSVDAAYNGHWWLTRRDHREPEWQLRGPFATPRELREAAAHAMAFLHPIGRRPGPA